MKKNSILLTILFASISGTLIAQTAKSSGPAVQERAINIDFSKTGGKLNTMFNECVGAGRANEGLQADWQQQLAYVRKECGFRYIRMHGLLTDDMAVYTEDSKGNPVYNYMYIDALVDFLQSIGMKPFIELGFMPSALASGPKTIFWWRGNVTPPKDYKKWGALVKDLTQHFTERYGASEVYSTYLSIGKPAQLTRQQVEQIKSQNDGMPVSKEIIKVKEKNLFLKELEIRENDVYFLNLIRLFNHPQNH